MDSIISVILPVYNAEKTVREAIQSIIDQTYEKWELIVINDGSTDGTELTILSFKDNRIKYFVNEGNRGLIYSLNRGLKLASSKYIARMDADDICYPERFEKQVEFMESHPDIIVSGTQIAYFGTKDTNYKKLKFPLDDKSLKEMLAISTCFAHPSVIIRKSMLESSAVTYDVNFKNAEDYSFWVDLIPYGKFANLSETLLHYRVSDTQISQSGNARTLKSVIECRKKYLRRLLESELVDSLFTSINIPVLKKVKRKTSNKTIWEACYLSLENYSISTLAYYLMSLDVFKLGFGTFIRFAKRYVMGKDPIYFDVI